MEINLVRIDDRLVHGQIVHAWLAASRAQSILVIDDLAARDKTTQMILSIAVPKTVKLTILSVEEGAKAIREGSIPGSVFVIVRSPAAALELCRMGADFRNINVGNISNAASKTGRTRLAKNLFLEQGDADALRALAALGIRLDTRILPTDPENDCMELVNKHFEK